VAINHHLDGIDNGPAHDSLAQVGIICLAAAAEHGFAGLIIEVFRVCNESVQIENDSAQDG
jgi:hypothetical protein